MLLLCIFHDYGFFCFGHYFLVLGEGYVTLRLTYALNDLLSVIDDCKYIEDF